MAARKKRGHGEGAIFQRPDGRWIGQFSMRGKNGRRKRKTVSGRTRAEVQDKLASLTVLKRTGQLANCDETTVSEWFRQWLAMSKQNYAASTFKRYTGIIDRHILPRLGHLKLESLKRIHVRDWLAQLAEDGVSAHSRRYALTVLRKCLNDAIDEELVAVNATARVKKPNPKPRDHAWLDNEQAKRLIEESEGSRFHAVIVLALETGMRQGEIFGLRWKNIDLAAAQIQVTHSMQEVAGRFELKEPKTAGSRRNIVLSQFAVAVLHEHRKRMLAEGHAGVELVFCDTLGNPVRKSNFQRRFWSPLKKAAELPSSLRFHDLRHSSASSLLAGGLNPKVIAERLGHADIRTTLNIYTHCLPSMQQEAADFFDDLLAKNGSAKAAHGDFQSAEQEQRKPQTITA